MEYPITSEYLEAVQYSESFESSLLSSLTPVLDSFGKPMMTGGNFAVVFRMRDTSTGEDYALKCFTQEQPGRAEAYGQIMSEMRYVDSPYFLPLDYIDSALWAGSYDHAFPAVLMPWVEGEPLDQHIQRLAQSDPERLSLVSYKFSVMASWLVNQPFAHGDIKPDNIMVRPDGSMVLVDYDGLYVPAMKGEQAREAGTPAFRHPLRTSMPFGEHIDDFPLASINLSLYLISLKPSLLESHGAKDRLLFSDLDYSNLSGCRLLPEIASLSYDTQLQRLYALFLIALSEGSLQRCENRLMLLSPPQKDFRLPHAVSAARLPSPPSSVSGQDTPFTVNGVSFRMIAVKGGTFTMGATSEQGDDANDWEKPAHQVTLSDYYIGETQVTQELWHAVMGSNPSCFTGNLQRPVERVSWHDCQAFIKKLNELTGRTFRLPTEAEWEYAARGGSKSRGYKYSGGLLFLLMLRGHLCSKSRGYKYSGGDNIYAVAWYRVNCYYKGESHPDYGTHPVGQKQPNELGLYDMSGNVWEWCQDWKGDYSSGSQTNPTGPSSGVSRVLRGGCWYNGAWHCRVSCRYDGDPGNRFNASGLRLVLAVDNV